MEEHNPEIEDRCS